MAEGSSSTTTLKKIPTVAKVQEMIDKSSITGFTNDIFNPCLNDWSIIKRTLSCYDEYNDKTEKMTYTNHIVYGNGVFIATNSLTNCYGYSTDGKNWTACLPDEFAASLFDKWRPLKNFYFLNGKFYNYIDNYYFSSSDGKTWTHSTVTLPDDSLTIKKVIYGNDQYMAILSDDSVWRERSVGDHDPSFYDDTAYDIDGDFDTTTNIAVDLCYGNGKLIVLYKGTKNSYTYCNDSKAFEVGSELPTSNLNKIEYVNDKFFIYSTDENDNTILYSTDGLTWGTITLECIAPKRKIIYGNDVYIIVTEGPAYMYYSKDGINWVKFILYGGLTYECGITDMVYANNIFVATTWDGDCNPLAFYLEISSITIYYNGNWRKLYYRQNHYQIIFDDKTITY